MQVVPQREDCIHGTHQASGWTADRCLLQGDGDTSVRHRGDDGGGGTEGEKVCLEREG